jgi:hypothetical protein
LDLPKLDERERERIGRKGHIYLKVKEGSSGCPLVLAAGCERQRMATFLLFSCRVIKAHKISIAMNIYPPKRNQIPCTCEVIFLFIYEKMN